MFTYGYTSTNDTVDQCKAVAKDFLEAITSSAEQDEVFYRPELRW